MRRSAAAGTHHLPTVSAEDAQVQRGRVGPQEAPGAPTLSTEVGHGVQGVGGSLQSWEWVRPQRKSKLPESSYSSVLVPWERRGYSLPLEILCPRDTLRN